MINLYRKKSSVAHHNALKNANTTGRIVSAATVVAGFGCLLINNLCLSYIPDADDDIVHVTQRRSWTRKRIANFTLNYIAGVPDQSSSCLWLSYSPFWSSTFLVAEDR